MPTGARVNLFLAMATIVVYTANSSLVVCTRNILCQQQQYFRAVGVQSIIILKAEACILWLPRLQMYIYLLLPRRRGEMYNEYTSTAACT